MERDQESPIRGRSNTETIWNLRTTNETAAILRVSRRTVEEMGKRYEKSRREFPPENPPPSCPRFGLRRTTVTKRKHFYNETDIKEFLNNCRRVADGLEPIHFQNGGHDGGEGRSKTQGKTKGD